MPGWFCSAIQGLAKILGITEIPLMDSCCFKQHCFLELSRCNLLKAKNIKMLFLTFKHLRTSKTIGTIFTSFKRCPSFACIYWYFMISTCPFSFIFLGLQHWLSKLNTVISADISTIYSYIWCVCGISVCLYILCSRCFTVCNVKSQSIVTWSFSQILLCLWSHEFWCEGK